VTEKYTDVKIKDGDTVISTNGKTVYTKGTEAVFQRALFCILTKRGRFIYKKDMGFEGTCSPQSRGFEENLQAQLMEALLPIEGIEVYVDGTEEISDSVRKANITLIYEGQEYKTEVIINGEL